MTDHEREQLARAIRREVCEELAALGAVLFERLAATLDHYLDGEETPAAEPEGMDAFTGGPRPVLHCPACGRTQDAGEVCDACKCSLLTRFTH